MKIWEGSELVPGGGINLDYPQVKTHENWGGESKLVLKLGGVRAGPRRWDELGPAKTKICKKLGGVRAGPRKWDELGSTRIKIVKIWEGSELVPGGGMNRTTQNRNSQKSGRGPSWSQEIG